jgi:hypothetical protein
MLFSRSENKVSLISSLDFLFESTLHLSFPSPSLRRRVMGIVLPINRAYWEGLHWSTHLVLHITIVIIIIIIIILHGLGQSLLRSHIWFHLFQGRPTVH